MKRLMGTLGIVGLLFSSTVLAQAPTAQAPTAEEQAAKRNSLLRAQETSAVAVGNNQTAVACSLCFTCGGDWPVFAGATASGTVTERGASCGNPLVTRTDNPFLCCR
jgi:hypothetical protein